jgi:hypothetical protein
MTRRLGTVAAQEDSSCGRRSRLSLCRPSARGRRGDADGARGGYYTHVAKKVVHYAWADAGTLVQVHGIGPFVINYVNPDGSPVPRDKQ